MDGVPLDTVTLEVVLVAALEVVLAVQVSLEAVGEPPGAAVVFGTGVVVSGCEGGWRGGGVNVSLSNMLSLMTLRVLRVSKYIVAI